MAASSESPHRSPGAPTGAGKRRRWLRWFGGGALVVVLVVGAALYWRQPIAGAALRAGLERMGLPGAELSVEALSFTRLRVVGIRLGGEVDVALAELTFDLSRWSDRPVTRLAIEHARLDLTDPAGPLRRRLDAPRAAAGPGMTLRQVLDGLPRLPSLALSDIVLSATAGGRPVTVTGALDAGANAAGDYAGRLRMRVAGELSGAARTLAVNGTFSLGAASSVLDATFGVGDGAATGGLTLRADLSPTGARVRGDMRVAIAEPDELSALVPALANAGGTLTLAVRTTEPVAVPLNASLDRAGLTGALRRAATGGLTLDASIADGRHELGLTGLNGTLSALAGVSDEIARGLHIEGRVSLQAGRITLAGATATDATLNGPFRIEQGEDALSMVLPEPVALTASDLVSGDSIVIEPLSATLSGGRTHALRLHYGASPPRPDLRLKIELGATHLWSGAGPGHRFDIAPVVLRLAGNGDADGTLSLHVRVPTLSVAEARREATVDDLALSLRKAGNSVTGNVRGRLSLREGGRRLTAPVDTQADLALWRDILTFDARARALDAVSLTATGRHDLIAGTGKVDLALEPVRFMSGGVELSRLLPVLSGAEIRAGSAKASARLAWAPDATDGNAALRIDGMDVAAGGVTAEGLSADIRLDRTMPPRTPPGQTVRVARIGAGAPLEDLALRFSLVDGASPAGTAVKLENLTGRFAGGRLLVSPTVIDTGAATGEARLEVADVDLAVLLGLFGLDGVSGTGRLSGAIPIVRDGGSVAIDGGRLAAAGPGVLRIRSEAAGRALAQGGADVTLMLRALEDFRYETLTLGIDKAAAGEGRVTIRTRGHNPAVRDGQPFIINLNVSGNVDRLAAIAARLLELPAAVVRSMVPEAP